MSPVVKLIEETYGRDIKHFTKHARSVVNHARNVQQEIDFEALWTLTSS